MRYLVTAAAAAMLSAGAAQAAVYQYDVTMDLSDLKINGLYSSGDNAPEPQLEGLECSFTDAYRCEGSGDFTENRYGLELLSKYTPTISGSFVLDTDSNSPAGSQNGQSAKCSGSELLCGVLTYSGLGSSFLQSASSESFDLRSFSNSYNHFVTDEGLSYADDSSYRFDIGNTTYTSLGSGIAANYITTSLEITEIAPIPLPASLPLLAVGMAGMALASRRRKS